MSNEEKENKRQIEDLGIEESAGYKNLIAIRDYAKKTREMFRLLQVENELYKKQIQQQSIILTQLREQMTQLQIKLYSKNSTA